MKIVVFGASGKTGALIVEQALDAGHIVVAYIRTAGTLKLQHANLKICIGNLNEYLRMRDALQGADVVISALGGQSLTQHAFEFIEGINLILHAMEQLKIERFIYLSSIGAGESRKFMCPISRIFVADLILRIPLADHSINEKRISRSPLKWTLIRPGGLTEGPISKNINFGNEKASLPCNLTISRSSVASFILQQITNTKYINKAVWLYV